MAIIDLILSTYAQFFDLNMWIDIFTNPVNWGLIATLVLMEGLLSADNAIALAVKVKSLPEHQRKKALMYGLWGAYFFRFLAIGLGTALVKLWWVKLIGGLYLVWMAYRFFKEYYAKKRNGEIGEEIVEESTQLSGLARYIGVFWATVVSVELMDIAFSVDSVLAAFGISELVGILLLGGMLGILMMRGMAQVFTKLMDKVPELENTAYILIGFIGVKMLLTLVHIHINHTMFFVFIIVIFFGTYLIHKRNKKKEA